LEKKKKKAGAGGTGCPSAYSEPVKKKGEREKKEGGEKEGEESTHQLLFSKLRGEKRKRGRRIKEGER